MLVSYILQNLLLLFAYPLIKVDFEKTIQVRQMYLFIPVKISKSTFSSHAGRSRPGPGVYQHFRLKYILEP